MLMQVAVNNAMQATDIKMPHQSDASCINHAFCVWFSNSFIQYKGVMA
jgi:hypothetical protein